ncbi:MAG: hypothetical protein WDN46_23845 [Methylocella sp.]
MDRFLFAISKPPPGTACPDANTFKAGGTSFLVDSDNNQVVSPTPAIQTDASATGYVVARSGPLPSTELWFFNVTEAANGDPVFGAARGVTVASYDVPADASQPTFTQVLTTIDARPNQAVQAIDPRTNTFSFWTEQTHRQRDGLGRALVRDQPRPDNTSCTQERRHYEPRLLRLQRSDLARSSSPKRNNECVRQ